MKAVFFATGPVPEAARQIAELSRRYPADSLRVVAPAAMAEELLSATGRPVLRFRAAALPALLLRLWTFLGREPAEVLCLSCVGGRFLKLAAYALRGRVVFVRPGQGSVRLGLGRFLWVFISRLWARQNGVLLVGSASPQTLARLEEDLRRRRPGATIRVLRGAGVLEFVRVALEWRRYGCISVPWTGEGHNVLKLAALLLPCGRREISNEHGDSYGLRRVGTLVRHLWWRLRELLPRVWRRLRELPLGVTVLGSASGYYLEGIVGDLRFRHPGEVIHGLLLPRSVVPAGPLFDSVTVLRPWAPAAWVSLLRRCLGRARTGWYVIPCTNESFYQLKMLGWLLPLGRRLIYNENHDAFPLRSWSMLARHLTWRLRHRLFYQALTERRGRPWPVQVVHLLLYPARLLLGAGLLAAVRLRAIRQRPTSVAGPQPAPLLSASQPQPQEVLDTAER